MLNAKGCPMTLTEEELALLSDERSNPRIVSRAALVAVYDLGIQE